MPANARPLPVDAPDIDVALATVITDLNSALTKLTSILSATDHLEGYSDTIEPKLQSLIDALAGTLSVETKSVAFEVTARSDLGGITAYTEAGVDWTITRDPDTDAVISVQSA